MPKRKEVYSISSVIAFVVFSLIGLGLAVLVVVWVATDLWGASFSGNLGGVRDIPVWLAWVNVPLGLWAGLHLFFYCAGYLYRVARGQVPRRPLTRDQKRKRDSLRKLAYDGRKQRRRRAKHERSGSDADSDSDSDSETPTPP
jgi:hypothetical protein